MLLPRKPRRARTTHRERPGHPAHSSAAPAQASVPHGEGFRAVAQLGHAATAEAANHGSLAQHWAIGAVSHNRGGLSRAAQISPIGTCPGCMATMNR